MTHAHRGGAHMPTTVPQHHQAHLDDGVEGGQREQQLAPGGGVGLGGAPGVQQAGRQLGVGAGEVGAQPLGRLLGDLDAWGAAHSAHTP